MCLQFGPVATPLPFARRGWVSAHCLGSRQPRPWSLGLGWGGRGVPRFV